MRKFSILLFSFLLSFVNLLPVSANSSKPRIIPESEANITYVSSPEEYLAAIRNPHAMTVNIIDNLDLRNLDFKNEIVVDGFDRIINFNNHSVSFDLENDFSFNYKTENFLNLRSTIGAMNPKINSLENSPLLYKTTKNGSGIIEDSSFSQTILIDNEILDLENNPTLIRNGEIVAKFSKTVSSDADVNFYLELNNYSGDNIEFLNFPNYSYTTILLSGKNTIKTSKEIGIKIENSNLLLDVAEEDKPAVLNIEVNSASDTAIGVARGIENPEDQQEISVLSKDLTFNLSLKNSIPSDSPFLTGFYARHGKISLSEPSTFNVEISPNLISETVSSTNNLTGATTDLDGTIYLYRNNLTVKNEKGTYGFFSGNVSFLDGNLSDIDPYTDLTSPETKIITKNFAPQILNHKNINDVYYNTNDYVEKLEEKDGLKISTLKNLIHSVEIKYDEPEPFLDTEIDTVLEEIKSSFRFINYSKADLENLSIIKNPVDNNYYLKIDLKPAFRYGFKKNCEKSYSYKDIFIKEEAHENRFYLNNERTENYQINSIDSASIFAPLSVIETEEPVLERTLLEEPEEPEAPKTPENPNELEVFAPEDPEKPELSTELHEAEIPNTKNDAFVSLYFIFFFLSAIITLWLSYIFVMARWDAEKQCSSSKSPLTTKNADTKSV